MRKIAVVLLLVSLAVPAASASPRGDDSDGFGSHVARIVHQVLRVVHVLEDLWPTPPKP